MTVPSHRPLPPAVGAYRASEATTLDARVRPMQRQVQTETAARRSWRGLFRALRKRTLKGLAKGFPLNEIRVRSLRAAGYTLGKNVYIGPEFYVADELFSNACHLSIGDRVAIAPRVLVVLSSHSNGSRLGEHLSPVHGRVTIEDDAWIGAGAILLPNIKIGERAVVGAGAVVTKDVPPKSVVAGNPARFLRASVAEDTELELRCAESVSPGRVATHRHSRARASSSPPRS